MARAARQSGADPDDEDYEEFEEMLEQAEGAQVRDAHITFSVKSLNGVTHLRCAVSPGSTSCLPLNSLSTLNTKIVYV